MASASPRSQTARSTSCATITGSATGAPGPAAGRALDPGGSRGAAHRAGVGSHERTDRRGRVDPGDPPEHADAEDEGVRPVRDPSVSGGPGVSPPVRVERALGLLPDLEVLNPLRGLLVSISRPDERTMWSSSGPYLTLGKRSEERRVGKECRSR